MHSLKHYLGPCQHRQQTIPSKSTMHQVPTTIQIHHASSTYDYILNLINATNIHILPKFPNPNQPTNALSNHKIRDMEFHLPLYCTPRSLDVHSPVRGSRTATAPRPRTTAAGRPLAVLLFLPTPPHEWREMERPTERNAR